MLVTTNAQSSPVNVIDIWTVIKFNSKDAGQKLQVPPIDSFTASCTEDSGSISSVSTQEPLDDATPAGEGRRPIFIQYWKKTGERPIQLKSRTSLPSSISIKQQERINGIPEPSKDGGDGDSPERRGERRSIFENRYAPRHSPSAGSLPAIPHLTPIIARRAKSTSALPDDRPLSCLRRKGDRPRRRSSSVSFDEKVNVVLFQRPQETWSAEGWSKLFAL